MAKIQDIRSKTPRTNGTRSIRNIKHIARHHSATTDGDWDSFWKYWHNTKGWGTGGYHEIILRDGTVQLCYDPTEITNGVANHNSTTYHITLVGNGSFTAEQERSWEERALFNMGRFSLSADNVLGHKEFSGASTTCPGVDMKVVRNRLKSLLQEKKQVNTASAKDSGKRYRLFTGTFNSKESAKKAAAMVEKEFGWITHIREE